MKKANQTTAFLPKNLSSCPKDVKAKCYKCIVRPQLEYASTVWDSVTKSNSANVESVQRRAARFCYDDYRRTSTITSMLQEIGWEDLQSRREQNKVAMMYRIVNNLVEIPADQYLTATSVSTTGHQQRFLIPYSINAYNRLQSVSGIVCLSVPYQHQLWMTSRSSSVLESQECNCQIKSNQFYWYKIQLQDCHHRT